MACIRHNDNSNSGKKELSPILLDKRKTDNEGTNIEDRSDVVGSNPVVTSFSHEEIDNLDEVKTYSDKEFRSMIVNERAQRRKRSLDDDYTYGLAKNYADHYPKLASELEDFYTFMTQPSTYSQENPVREATAKVYLNHAKLFLGWCCQNNTSSLGSNNVLHQNFSLFDVVPNKDKESANNIIRFVLWIRSRDVSVSYEANLLRGIIKLLKYRFRFESNSDPLDGKNSFDDIAIIKEVRKLHRDANQRQRLAPRSSDESKKWISWQDFLAVCKNTKNEVLQLIQNYEQLPPSDRKYAKGDTERIYSLEQTRVEIGRAHV